MYCSDVRALSFVKQQVALQGCAGLSKGSLSSLWAAAIIAAAGRAQMPSGWTEAPSVPAQGHIQVVWRGGG